jgi:hypothetical protein
MSNLCSRTCSCGGQSYTITYPCTGWINGGAEMCRQFCKLATERAIDLPTPGVAVAARIGGVNVVLTRGTQGPSANVFRTLMQ